LQVIDDLDIAGDCLDFGAGTGNLTRLIQDLKCFNSITAADIMQFDNVNTDESLKAVHWINQDLNKSLSVPDEYFDVILSSEVIEHLENPRSVAREWFRLLRPSGTLIFSTPNNESYRSLMSLFFKGHFVAFRDTCYPAHITALLRKDMERILYEAGFIKPKFIFTDCGSIPNLPTIKYQKFFRFLKGVRYSDEVYFL
jgi:2-polyprenyl-3-methyl-5-hydroxy-6-metoxy-1,4-benzoquinol methylase